MQLWFPSSRVEVDDRLNVLVVPEQLDESLVRGRAAVGAREVLVGRHHENYLARLKLQVKLVGPRELGVYESGVLSEQRALLRRVKEAALLVAAILERC